jgi:hypothetical protein
LQWAALKARSSKAQGQAALSALNMRYRTVFSAPEHGTGGLLQEIRGGPDFHSRMAEPSRKAISMRLRDG